MKPNPHAMKPSDSGSYFRAVGSSFLKEMWICQRPVGYGLGLRVKRGQPRLRPLQMQPPPGLPDPSHNIQPRFETDARIENKVFQSDTVVSSRTCLRSRVRFKGP